MITKEITLSLSQESGSDGWTEEDLKSFAYQKAIDEEMEEFALDILLGVVELPETSGSLTLPDSDTSLDN